MTIGDLILAALCVWVALFVIVCGESYCNGRWGR